MLSDTELLASPIVANSTMNRERGFVGANSYQRELKFDIGAFLEARVKANGHALWYDACCGEGLALHEAVRQFAQTDWGQHVTIVGVDLVGALQPRALDGFQLLTGDVVTFELPHPADLITCVHGLHYLGDKLGFLEHAYTMLAPNGRLLSHLDATNIRSQSSPDGILTKLIRQVHKSGIALDFKNHLLSLEKSDLPLRFGVIFEGATVSETPNYCGITVIDSWYR